MNAVGMPEAFSTKPRLWVETLWLLESLTADEPSREIPLRRGLNLIVSPPGKGSSGHGVGKTAFCQLLRFALDDPLWSEGSALRDELLQSEDLKEGAVAARVHIGGQAWTVLKPWRHQKMYRASRHADWRQLAAGNAENEYHAYQNALRQHFVETLPVQELPGSGQPIEWHHILAWCSRDQNARYQHYFQWRAEGVRFSLPAKSPLALIQIVLGLLHDATTLHDLDSAKKAVEIYKARLEQLREEPARLLNHVRRQLANRLEAPINTPFRQEGLIAHPNLVGIARQRHEAYQKELLTIEEERKALTHERMQLLEMLAPLKSRLGVIVNETAQKEALISGDTERLEALQNEAASLQKNLSNHCDAGNRLLKECDYVIRRIELVQIDRKQRTLSYQQTKESLERDLIPLRRRRDGLIDEMAPLDKALAAIDGRSADMDQRHAQALAADQLLTEAIEGYEYYESLASGKSQSTEINAVQRKLEADRYRRDQLKLKLEQQRQMVAGRRQAISDTMMAVARSLPSFTWGVFNDQEEHRNHPFRMGPRHSTTYKVLEILAGDVTCLLDSTLEQSFHPGFLLHDSPREAEMSEDILWALLEHVAKKGGDSLQYIVTTSTEPPESLQIYERHRLSTESVDGLLFRKRLGAEQAAMA